MMKMKCHKCGKAMRFAKRMDFNGYEIDGWKCSCGEIYYDPEQAQKILLINKLRKESIKAKLGKVRSNLILRLPKDLEYALNLEKGEDVMIKIEDGGFKVLPA
jgi:hypothetical protein